jgi:RNA polymerase sigma factor (sigma-70 family)
MTSADLKALSARFESDRARLRGVAYRLLGSLAEAEDAVQEAWLRLDSSRADEIGNLGGWLTTVVSRIALDMLRARKSRREEPVPDEDMAPAAHASARAHPDAEEEALLAEAVGIGLMVVLDRLEPAERLAFVLHDVFDVPFDDIAAMLGRSDVAVRQLASRARRRVRGDPPGESAGLSQQRDVIAAFFAAARSGNYAGLVAVLHPNVLLEADREVLPPNAPLQARGAALVAKRAQFGASQEDAAQLMLVNGRPGIAVAPCGRLKLVMDFVVTDGRISEVHVIANRGRLDRLELILPGDQSASRAPLR